MYGVQEEWCACDLTEAVISNHLLAECGIIKYFIPKSSK